MGSTQSGGTGGTRHCAGSDNSPVKAGIMIVPLISVTPAMGDPILITTLVVVIIGGIGSLRGALVGGLLVGVLDTFGRILFPLYFGTGTGSALANMTIYIVMAAVLLWRPRGLFPAAAG